MFSRILKTAAIALTASGALILFAFGAPLTVVIAAGTIATTVLVCCCR